MRLRDGLISAVRYAFTERRKGKLLEACEPYGRAQAVATAEFYNPRLRPNHRREPQVGKGVSLA